LRELFPGLFRTCVRPRPAPEQAGKLHCPCCALQLGGSWFVDRAHLNPSLPLLLALRAASSAPTAWAAFSRHSCRVE
jgi:hypothetical protein